MKVYAVVIYDIINDRKRTEVAKYLQGYGFRVQKSAFEVNLDKPVFTKMISGLSKFQKDEDSIRVYRIIGDNNIVCFDRNNKNVSDGIVIV